MQNDEKISQPEIVCQDTDEEVITPEVETVIIVEELLEDKA